MTRCEYIPVSSTAAVASGILPSRDTRASLHIVLAADGHARPPPARWLGTMNQEMTRFRNSKLAAFLKGLFYHINPSHCSRRKRRERRLEGV